MSNDLELSILEILKPKALDEILRLIRDGREKYLVTEYLEQVVAEEERKQEDKEYKENVAREARLMAQPGYLDWKANSQDKRGT